MTEVEPGSAPPPARWRPSLRGATARRLWLGVACGVSVGALVPTAAMFPYFRDDRALDTVVRVVALDWRDFGEPAARTRLEYELDHRGIGMWVDDRDCALAEGDVREVRCDWSVDVPVPGTRWSVPLAFSSRADLLPDGDVR